MTEEEQFKLGIDMVAEVVLSDNIDSPWFLSDSGLCSNIHVALTWVRPHIANLLSITTIGNLVEDCAKDWPLNSGSCFYPVPGEVGYSAAKAYNELPHYEGKQLELRRDLILHIAKKVGLT